jgi:hypothetical protein
MTVMKPHMKNRLASKVRADFCVTAEPPPDCAADVMGAGAI